MSNLFVFDVDGTLITSDHRVLPSTRKALKTLREKGHRIMLASARPPRSIRRMIRELGIESGAFISLNGAFVVDGDGSARSVHIEGRPTREIVQKARSDGLHVNYYSESDWYVETRSPYIDREARIMGFSPTRRSDLLDEVEESACKLLIMGDESDVPGFQGWLQKQGRAVEATLSKPIYCEVVRRGVSKGKALEDMLQRSPHQHHRVIGFGDGENDVGMLERVDVSVAMRNSPESVKQIADRVARSNDEDAIQRALEQLGFL